MKKSFVLATLFLLWASLQSAYAQPVYERHTHEVYNYLMRMAQKGMIEFNDNVRPLSKTYILSCLDSLQTQSAKLTQVERAEMIFYAKEFREGERKRLLSAKDKDFTLWADPIVTAGYSTGAGRTVKSKSIGINFWGKIGNRLGYQFSFHDQNISGTALDTTYRTLEAGNTTGIVGISQFKPNQQDNAEMRVNIRYEFNKGGISVGQDFLTWGYGENGRLVLSDKAPVYPYIRLDYQPLPWLRFNYTHAWLRSNIIDSSGIYPLPSPPIYGPNRDVEISKYMASHSVDFTLKKGLVFSIGESIVYNDRLKIGYLIPLMFFKAYDNTNNTGGIERGSNGQFFFQLSSRDQIRNTHVYGTLFIDEIKIGTIFNQSKSRNQLGYTVGGSVTDIFTPYLTLGAEYTKVRPFVYRNLIPGQNYTHQNYLLGDWMGSNADRALVYAKYTPLPRLKLYARYTHLRKGGAGTLEQQYLQEPQPPFLFDFQQRSDEFLFNASYEPIYRLNLNANFRRFDNNNFISLGLTYGL